jgi:2',3'-cyclic-nucleotide 2'-phosphodiesterase (5'-nucleotidase family)
VRRSLHGRSLAVLLLAVLPSAGASAQEAGCLVILHNNDAESQLLNAGRGLEDFGGAARFVTVVREQRDQAEAKGCAVLTLSSGDNFLAGPEFTASLEKGVPFYDSIVVDAVAYDALAVGNHEFDFGPDVFAEFVGGTRDDQFLSANLDFSAEPALQAFVDEGRIEKRRVVTTTVGNVGIIGATTAELPSISSPRKVNVAAVRPALEAEIEALESEGIERIILISHLQSVEEDIALLSSLHGIDVAIAGGGDELLANAGTLLVPDDEDTVYGPYPLLARDSTGKEVPVVTTPGDYQYVGRLEVSFDDKGQVVGAVGDPVRVAGGDQPDAVQPDPDLERLVTRPVQSFVDRLAEEGLGMSEVALDGRRSPGVRTQETNLGNLMADALLAAGRNLAPAFGAKTPDVGLQNGGGIRNNSLIPAGEISALDTFDVAPFSNFVAVVEDVPPQQFKEIMENAVSQVEQADGRFAQIAGFTMIYDPKGTAQVLADDGGTPTPGTRVREIRLADGTAIIEKGTVAEGAPSLTIATIDFSARGGDQYPFRGKPFTTLGISYQQALARFIADGLGGRISAADYPEAGEGRIRTAN